MLRPNLQSIQRYKPVYLIGDRVRGIWRGAPFTGTVAIDTNPSGTRPYIVVNLDLPLKLDGEWYTMLQVEHSCLIDIKGKYGTNSKTNRKKSVVGGN